MEQCSNSLIIFGNIWIGSLGGYILFSKIMKRHMHYWYCLWDFWILIWEKSYKCGSVGSLCRFRFRLRFQWNVVILWVAIPLTYVEAADPADCVRVNEREPKDSSSYDTMFFSVLRCNQPTNQRICPSIVTSKYPSCDSPGSEFKEMCTPVYLLVSFCSTSKQKNKKTSNILQFNKRLIITSQNNK